MKKYYSCFVIFLLSGNWLAARLPGGLTYDFASRAAQQGDWEQAEKLLSSFLIDSPDRADLLYDLGVASCQNADLHKAATYLSHAAACEGIDDSLREKAHFNAGNVQVALHELEKAIAEYEKVLAINNDNEFAQHNLEKVKEMLKQQQEQEQKEQEQQKEKEDKQQQDQKKKKRKIDKINRIMKKSRKKKPMTGKKKMSNRNKISKRINLMMDNQVIINQTMMRQTIIKTKSLPKRKRIVMIKSKQMKQAITHQMNHHKIAISRTSKVNRLNVVPIASSESKIGANKIDATNAMAPMIKIRGIVMMKRMISRKNNHKTNNKIILKIIILLPYKKRDLLQIPILKISIKDKKNKILCQSSKKVVILLIKLTRVL